MFWESGISLESMPRLDRRKFRGQYQVVFDGSGTIDQDRAVVYAGAGSSVAQWAAFTEAWDMLLAKHDLAYFKMAEAATFYGEFLPKVAEWGADRGHHLTKLLLEFASLKTRYALTTNGCGFVIGTEQTSPFTTTSVADRKKEQFQCAIRALLRAV